MKGKGFVQLYDGDAWEINTKKDILRFSCCDCGLVHDIPIIIVDKKMVKLGFFVNKRSTTWRRKALKKRRTDGLVVD